jgi:hypothetical protein
MCIRDRDKGQHTLIVLHLQDKGILEFQNIMKRPDQIEEKALFHQITDESVKSFRNDLRPSATRTFPLTPALRTVCRSRALFIFSFHMYKKAPVNSFPTG